MPRESSRDGPDDVGHLYDRLGPSLFRYALMILARPEEAEDAVQQVFAGFLRLRGRALDSTDGYLWRAIRNECYSTLRRRRRRAREVVDTALLEAVEGTPDQPVERLAIERALQTLAPEQREVVHLKIFEGLTFREIANLSGEPINTVASRYRYALNKLGPLLEGVRP